MIELMVVTAILGVLASVAMPKYANMVLKSREAAVKGHLGSLRSALSLYYSDNEGVFPSNAAALSASLTTRTKYLKILPTIQVPPPANHPASNLVTGTMADNGRWFYSGSARGQLAVCCRTHRTIDRRIWSTW